MINDKHLTLEEDVDDKAKMLIDRINEETEYMRKKSLKKFMAELKLETESYRENELEELQSEMSSSLLVSKHKNKKELFSIRENYASEIFSEIDRKLEEFVESDLYPEFIAKCLDKYEVNYNEGYFMVKAEDLDLFKGILNDRNIESEIKTDYIKTGGFRFISKKNNIMIDETIENRLEIQKKWFQQNSGFII